MEGSTLCGSPRVVSQLNSVAGATECTGLAAGRLPDKSVQVVFIVLGCSIHVLTV